MVGAGGGLLLTSVGYMSCLLASISMCFSVRDLFIGCTRLSTIVFGWAHNIARTCTGISPRDGCVDGPS